MLTSDSMFSIQPQTRGMNDEQEVNVSLNEITYNSIGGERVEKIRLPDEDN